MSTTSLADKAKDAESVPENGIDVRLVDAILRGFNRNLILENYTAKLGTASGDNFMSIMYAVTVKGKTLSSGKEETLNAMVKKMPKNQAIVQMINNCQAFVKEIKMYEQVFPGFEEFQRELGLGESVFTPWPKCYASLLSADGTDDFIALHDLRQEQYWMVRPREGLGLEETRLVMKVLGKFHAISYAKYKGDFKNLKTEFPYLKESLFRTPEMKGTWMRDIFQKEANLLRLGNPDGEIHAWTIENRLCQPKFWSMMHELCCSPPGVATICHGDCWTNNFLFQYEPVTRKLLNVKFVDFQLSRIGSRCLDLGYFLYTSPTIEILNEYEDELLGIYYQEFKAFATELGFFEPEHTLEHLRTEFESYRLYGIAIGCMLASITQSRDSPDADGISENRDMRMHEMQSVHQDKQKLFYDKIHNLAKHLERIK